LTRKKREMPQKKMRRGKGDGRNWAPNMISVQKRERKLLDLHGASLPQRKVSNKRKKGFSQRKKQKSEGAEDEGEKTKQ